MLWSVMRIVDDTGRVVSFDPSCERLVVGAIGNKWAICVKDYMNLMKIYNKNTQDQGHDSKPAWQEHLHIMYGVKTIAQFMQDLNLVLMDDVRTQIRSYVSLRKNLNFYLYLIESFSVLLLIECFFL